MILSVAVDVRKPEALTKPVELWVQSLRASFLSRVESNDETNEQNGLDLA